MCIYEARCVSVLFRFVSVLVWRIDCVESGIGMEVRLDRESPQLRSISITV